MEVFMKARAFIFGAGLYEYANEKLVKKEWADPFIREELICITDIDNNKYIVGTRNGLYLLEGGKIEEWDVPANDFVKKNKLISSARIAGNYLAFGSVLDGVFISDINGRLVQHLNKENGLQNNTVLSMMDDNHGNTK